MIQNPENVNGVGVYAYYHGEDLVSHYRLLITDLPKTALQISVPVDLRFVRVGVPNQFQVLFRRLGSVTGPATVHYSTRDVTTTADAQIGG